MNLQILSSLVVGTFSVLIMYWAGTKGYYVIPAVIISICGVGTILGLIK